VERVSSRRPRIERSPDNRRQHDRPAHRRSAPAQILIERSRRIANRRPNNNRDRRQSPPIQQQAPAPQIQPVVIQVPVPQIPALQPFWPRPQFQPRVFWNANFQRQPQAIYRPRQQLQSRQQRPNQRPHHFDRRQPSNNQQHRRNRPFVRRGYGGRPANHRQNAARPAQFNRNGNERNRL
jgi:hypothetical protein